MHAPGSGPTRHLSGPDLLLVSSAFSQGPCLSFCFFRMPRPLKIFLVRALCSLFRSTWESPFSSSLLWVLYNCIPTAYSTYLLHYFCESKSCAWNRCLEWYWDPITALFQPYIYCLNLEQAYFYSLVTLYKETMGIVFAGWLVGREGVEGAAAVW